MRRALIVPANIVKHIIYDAHYYYVCADDELNRIVWSIDALKVDKIKTNRYRIVTVYAIYCSQHTTDQNTNLNHLFVNNEHWTIMQ